MKQYIFALILLFGNFSGFAQEFEWTDSICLKNPNLDINRGKQAFAAQLEFIISGFSEAKQMNLGKMLKYEASINSTENSLGYSYTVSEGIYPRVKRYKYGNPVSFRRLECPIFDGQVEYFYTKATKKVKLVLFSWKDFRTQSLLFGEEARDSTQIRKAFEDKYSFAISVVSSYLGKPILLNSSKDAGRMDTKWRSSNGISAYLFIFDSYNEIRLAVYVD
jgi:hypothetical protein